MTASENQIVVYQPNETVRLDVRLENETVWLTQLKIAELFGVQKAAISKHVKNIFASGELVRDATVSKLETVQTEGGRTVVRTMEQLETGNIGIGNTSTLATLHNDRFIIVDQKEIFWTGASLKDAGRLTFAAAKMGAEVIPGLLESIHKATSDRKEYGGNSKPAKSLRKKV